MHSFLACVFVTLMKITLIYLHTYFSIIYSSVRNMSFISADAEWNAVVCTVSLIIQHLYFIAFV